jgi:hypothetical protein
MAEPTVSNYPSALDNATSLGGDQVNIKSFVLGGSIGTGDTSIPASGSISGVTAPFYLLADSELIYVEGVSGSNFTPCVRGAGGTTAASHTSGITLFVVYAANLFNQVKRALIAIETELGINPSGASADVATRLDAIAGSMDRGQIWGLTLSNNATDPTNDIDIAVGEARDVDDSADMALASALIKQLDAAWAVGTNQGMLDTGSIANATYHIFLIKRTDTGVVDILASTSATAPTMPTNYTKKRRIGSIVRTGAAIKTFVQDGDLFTWKVPVQDVNASNPGTSAVTRTLTLPTGIRTQANISVFGIGTAVSTDHPAGIFISDLSQTDTAPTGTGVLTQYIFHGSASALYIASTMSVYTNTSAQVRSRIEVSTAATILRIVTHGWTDTRGRLA